MPAGVTGSFASRTERGRPSSHSTASVSPNSSECQADCSDQNHTKVPGAAALGAASQIIKRSEVPSMRGEVTMASDIEIPGSIRMEHSAIHEALVEATHASGQV